MSEADYREALRLLNAALALLERSSEGPTPDMVATLKSLTTQLDLLRVRAGQSPAERQRN